MSVKVSCTEADRVDIPVAVFSELVRESEKIKAVERYANSNKYAVASDILAILGIERAENNATDNG